MAIYAILAFLPILTALVLMVGFQWSSIKAMPMAWFVGVVLAFLVWELTPLRLAALTIQGFITASGVLLVIFGALLIYFTLLASGAMETIQAGMQKITPDRRLQAVIIGFLFSAFLEGAAGFGTPATLAAALLFGLGFPPLCAAIVCLLFNCAPVNFGVVGVPTMQGFMSIEKVGTEALQVSDPSLFYLYIGQNVTFMHMPMLFILPLMVLGIMTRYFGKNRSWKEGLSAWRYCLLATFCFGIPYVIIAWTAGPELPSLVGGLFGLGALVYLTKKGICVPKDVWNFDDRENWEKDWTGEIQTAHTVEFKAHMSQFKAWLPYVLSGFILALTRIPLFGLKPFVTDPIFRIGMTDILEVEGISAYIDVLNSPGILPFIVLSVMVVFYHNMLKDDEIGKNKVRTAWANTFKKIKAPTITLSFAVALVSIFKGTDATSVVVDALGNGISMPMAMAITMADLTGTAWIYCAPFVGGIGTFITGSSTVANMLLANFQWDIATALDYNAMQSIVVIAAQGTGAAMGSMISITAMVSTCTVLGLIGHEGRLLRLNIIPFIIYAITIAIVSGILINIYMQ